MAKIHDSKKTPSFPFYPKDWLTDLKVQSLSFEEQGIYLNLLCYSWLDDLPSDLDQLARLLRCDRQAIKVVVENFFEIQGDKIYNKRLEKIKQELLAFRTKMSSAGEKGNKVRWQDKQQKAKKHPIAKRSPSDVLAIAKNRSPIPIPIPIPIPSPSSSPISKTISKDIYGKLKNVKLLKNEYEELQKLFPNDFNEKIENLSLYIASKGDKYKSHYATILAWERKNNPKPQCQQNLPVLKERRSALSIELPDLN